MRFFQTRAIRLPKTDQPAGSACRRKNIGRDDDLRGNYFDNRGRLARHDTATRDLDDQVRAGLRAELAELRELLAVHAQKATPETAHELGKRRPRDRGVHAGT